MQNANFARMKSFIVLLRTGTASMGSWQKIWVDELERLREDGEHNGRLFSCNHPGMWRKGWRFKIKNWLRSFDCTAGFCLNQDARFNHEYRQKLFVCSTAERYVIPSTFFQKVLKGAILKLFSEPLTPQNRVYIYGLCGNANIKHGARTIRSPRKELCLSISPNLFLSVFSISLKILWKQIRNGLSQPIFDGWQVTVPMYPAGLHWRSERWLKWR